LCSIVLCYDPQCHNLKGGIERCGVQNRGPWPGVLIVLVGIRYIYLEARRHKVILFPKKFRHVQELLDHR